jgi:hypothetical protein
LRLGFGGILFEIRELKLEMFDDGTALGGLAVLLVARLGDGDFICSISSARPPRSAPSPPRQGAIFVPAFFSLIAPNKRHRPPSACTGDRCSFIENCRQHEGGTREQ